MKPDVWKPKAVWEQADKLDRTEHGVLIIDDIDDGWCDALCKRYPKTISRKFVLEHILGLDERARQTVLYEDEEESELERSLIADLQRLDRTFPDLAVHKQERLGGHVDCWKELDDLDDQDLLDVCYLSPGTSNRVKVNRFLSYCQLRENFCKSTFPRAKGYL